MSNPVSNSSSSQNSGLEECKSILENSQPSSPRLDPRVRQIVERARRRRENSPDSDAKRIRLSDSPTPQQPTAQLSSSTETSSSAQTSTEQSSPKSPKTEKTSNRPVADPDIPGASQFSYAGKEYRIYPTLGDGACAMHALLGSINEEGVYCLADARNILVERVQGTRETYFAARKYLPPLLKDYLQGSEDPYTLWLFNPFSGKVEKLKETLASTVKQEEREKLFMEFFTAPVLGNYVRLCQMREYPFSDCELAYAAELFNKNVTLFQVVEGEIGARTFGPSDGQPAWIFYTPGHYSFCKPKEDS